MSTKIRCVLLALTLALLNVLCAYAQPHPEVTPQPNNALAPKLAQMVIQTSSKAQVYLDDVFKGQASEDGRLVIENPKPGEHMLRVSLAGKKDFQRRIIAVAGKEVKIVATLAEPPGTAAPRSTQAHGPTPGQVRENPKDNLKYVWIPSGTFMMGCSPGDSECQDDEKPSHRVTISKGFWLGQTEVTVGAYKRFAAATGRQMPLEPNFRGRPLNPRWGDEAMPIINVTWDEAQAYCSWAGGCSRKRSGSMQREGGAPQRVMATWMKSPGTRTTVGMNAWTALGFGKKTKLITRSA